MKILVSKLLLDNGGRGFAYERMGARVLQRLSTRSRNLALDGLHCLWQPVYHVQLYNSIVRYVLPWYYFALAFLHLSPPNSYLP